MVKNRKITHEAVRRLMNTLKVDGLTRALTRQLFFALGPSFSLGFVGIVGFCLFFLGFAIKTRNFLLFLFGATRGANCPT